MKYSTNVTPTIKIMLPNIKIPIKKDQKSKENKIKPI